MYPGNDLDLEIARQIFKLVISIDSNTNERLIQDRAAGGLCAVPPYSTHVETAYQIINWFSNKGYACHMASKLINGNLMWYCCFSDQPPGGDAVIEYEGLTLPHAICRAALGRISDID